MHVNGLYVNRLHVNRWMLAAVFGVVIVSPARPAAIQINGACKLGDCNSTTPATATQATSLSDGQAASGTFNYDLTVNGDSYNVSGSYFASYSSTNGSVIQIDPVVAYTGDTPTAQTDTLTFDFFQNFDDPGCCWAGTYNEALPLRLNAPADSTIQAQILYDGQSVGLAGPFGPGSYFVENSADLDFGDNNASDFLSADFNVQVAFAAGTAEGGFADSPVPEPGTALPCALALCATACSFRRRR